MESTKKKGFKTSLILILKHNQSERKIFAMEKTDKALYGNQPQVLFFLTNFYVE